MKILIDIGHPAHFHYFKNLAAKLENNGSKIIFTIRNKEVTRALLEKSNFFFIDFGKPYKSLLGKVYAIFKYTFKLLVIANQYKVEFFINSTHYSAITAWLLRKPHISLEDTFNMEQVSLYLKFTSIVLTSDYPHPSLGRKEIKYSGYQELAYLHPKRFIPNPDVLKLLKINPTEKYVILRFVSWNASHDFGHKGITLENKIKLVKELSEYAKVFISSEAELPNIIQSKKINLPPELMHDAIYYSSMVLGESATMASEAAVLGVPGIYLDSTGRYYTKDQEKKYGLVFNFTESIVDQEKAINKAIELLLIPNLKEEWQRRRQRMLADKIDVTSFMVWFVENYPESARIMKENPDFQNNFK